MISARVSRTRASDASGSTTSRSWRSVYGPTVISSPGCRVAVPSTPIVAETAMAIAMTQMPAWTRYPP